MHEITINLSPDLWAAIVLGILTPLLHFALNIFVTFKSTHKSLYNWLIAIALPVVGSVAVALANDASFVKAVPLYPVIFTTAQLFYFGAIKWWKKAMDLTVPAADQVV